MGNFDFPWQLSSISESKDGDSIEWRSDRNIFLCPLAPLVNTEQRTQTQTFLTPGMIISHTKYSQYCQSYLVEMFV